MSTARDGEKPGSRGRIHTVPARQGTEAAGVVFGAYGLPKLLRRGMVYQFRVLGAPAGQKEMFLDWYVQNDLCSRDKLSLFHFGAGLYFCEIPDFYEGIEEARMQITCIPESGNPFHSAWKDHTIKDKKTIWAKGIRPARQECQVVAQVRELRRQVLHDDRNPSDVLKMRFDANDAIPNCADLNLNVAQSGHELLYDESKVGTRLIFKNVPATVALPALFDWIARKTGPADDKHYAFIFNDHPASEKDIATLAQRWQSQHVFLIFTQ